MLRRFYLELISLIKMQHSIDFNQTSILVDEHWYNTITKKEI